MSGGRKLGLLWGTVALALLVLSPLASAFAGALPECYFRRLSGFPCLTCGGTRAALALVDGNLPAAFRANPLVTVALVVLVGGGLAAGVRSLAGPGVSDPERLPGWVRPAVLLALAANWLWLISQGR